MPSEKKDGMETSAAAEAKETMEKAAKIEEDRMKVMFLFKEWVYRASINRESPHPSEVTLH